MFSENKITFPTSLLPCKNRPLLWNKLSLHFLLNLMIFYIYFFQDKTITSRPQPFHQDDKRNQPKVTIRTEQYALNKFKLTELNMKNQLDRLQISTEQRKSFSTLSLLITKIKESTEELKTNSYGIMKEKISSISINSVMKRNSNLISRLEKFEKEVNSLDDDDQLIQSLTWVRDDINCFSQPSETQLESQRLTPVSQNEK